MMYLIKEMKAIYMFGIINFDLRVLTAQTTFNGFLRMIPKITPTLVTV